MYFGRRLTNCRMCESSNLYEFLDLGFLPPADRILSNEHLNEPEIHFPLKVAQCQDCGLTQLTYVVAPEILYGESYSYESSITEIGKRHFFEMADSIFEKFNLRNNDLVVDIGSNVGVLLEGFKKRGCRVLGIDPAPRIIEIANKRGIETWKGFINKEIAKKILDEKGKARVITGTNVFAHIDDKKGLIESLKILLDENGIFVIEVPYFVDLIDNLEYDTIYLDHLEYLTVRPLVKFFEKNGFEVFDVEKYGIHGNSIRVFISKKWKKSISKNVENFLELEEESGVYKKEILNQFSNKVKKHKKEFLDFLLDLKKQGKKIVGISAPAKGNTLLNYCKIHDNLIEYMTEKSKIKLNYYTPGMHIPIIEEEKLLNDSVDFGVIFAWNFADEIIKNPINQEFMKRGGKFIIPIPKPKIIDIENNKNFNNNQGLMNKENIGNIKHYKISEVHKSEISSSFPNLNINNRDISDININNKAREVWTIDGPYKLNNLNDITKKEDMKNKNTVNNILRDKNREGWIRESSSDFSNLNDTNNENMNLENKNLFGANIKKINPIFIDERGIISDLINEPINHVGLITTEKEAVRGSHYHRKSKQYSYILQGKFEVLLAPYDQPVNIKKVIVNVGEIIIIPPLVIHQFKALDRAIMINMESQSRADQGYEEDTIRVKIDS